mmetsp:Transcript_25572/g.71469  ORF Transcript_25572/g.71469 Transcript_25572/m.71469 type:complete len:180 (+) Transcript_25572:154-693(+)|eukprot:CAMPEP_0119562584 /NCGR_PEP_ID=MMETSP1352-20130426/20913_1 /TAXON_ID=265584 /ORGANISM="Stauroneis constricta, Strain CCMP1120" /LENGTH=179 /DNA_ID=CAMNT_0007611021 /DNA_START=124 /DNA_END=663 /DNA_ORIENTATION=-
MTCNRSITTTVSSPAAMAAARRRSGGEGRASFPPNSLNAMITMNMARATVLPGQLGSSNSNNNDDDGLHDGQVTSPRQEQVGRNRPSSLSFSAPSILSAEEGPESVSSSSPFFGDEQQQHGSGCIMTAPAFRHSRRNRSSSAAATQQQRPLRHHHDLQTLIDIIDESIDILDEDLLMTM